MTQGLGILDGILNEIASSFVSLTPRNDGILEFFFLLALVGQAPLLANFIRAAP